ncbi:MAG: RNA 2',3'-cyclic phosphodiesterase [Anaerolineae bacterium]
MTTLRTFIAIELDPHLKAKLAELQGQLRTQLPARSIRWVQPDSIHLTLKFLGDTSLEQVEEVKVALTQAAVGVEPFSFTVGKLGCFPNNRQPRVVWVGLQEPTGRLARLQQAVEKFVAPLGFPTEGRPFSPHLTLGRVQHHASRAEVHQIGEVVAASAVGILDEMTVTAISYIKSDLRPSGAVYTTLFQAELRNT